MAVMRYREALNQAMREEMRADESVFLMGEDVGVFQGAFKVSEGMLEEFGEKRVRDTPISENTIVGMGVGAAMAGLRPIVEIMTVNFALLAMDQIINSAAHIHYMFGGQAKVPLVVRFPQGGGHQLGPTHSHTMEAIFLHVPGLLVAVPSTPADAKGLLKAAIRDDNPVVYIEHESLYGMRGEVPDNGGPMRFGEAAIRREGNDVTIVGVSRMAITAERAAEKLASDEDIEAEVIDPRTLRPLDLDTILESVRKTNRCVVVEEGWPHGGVGANIAALVQEQAFDDLDAPVQRVTGADVPMPYSKALEQAAIPHEEHVVKAALATFRDVRSDGRRRRHAAPVRLHGGGHRAALAEVGRRRGEARRRAGRDRDRQGEHDLRGDRRGHAGRDPGRRGRDAADRRADRADRRPERSRAVDGRPAEESRPDEAKREPERRSREPKAQATAERPRARTVWKRPGEGVTGRAAHGTRPERAARVDPGLGPGRPHREGRRGGGRGRRSQPAPRGKPADGRLRRATRSARPSRPRPRARCRSSSSRACRRPSRGAWRSRRRPFRTSTSRWRST